MDHHSPEHSPSREGSESKSESSREGSPPPDIQRRMVSEQAASRRLREGITDLESKIGSASLIGHQKLDRLDAQIAGDTVPEATKMWARSELEQIGQAVRGM